MENVKTILCPFDFSEHSELALCYAAAFAEQNHCRLIVFHSLPVSAILAGLPPAPILNEPIWQDEMKALLDKKVVPYANRKINISTKMESGDPAVQILRTAEEENADFIVMGTHGLSGYQALLIGSVTNKILHKTKVPVLTVCRPTKAILSGDPDEPLLIGKILCAVDPLHVSLAALNTAFSLARSFKSTLRIVTVGESEANHAAARNLEELMLREKERFCKVEFIHVEGDPITQILNNINEFEADLAVMGHHKKSLRSFEVLGSVTLRVIPRSSCAVLVVHD
jgi:nucleotide-binding universal stress UspA family protein